MFFVWRLSLAPDFVTEDKVSNDSEADEEDSKADDVDPEHTVLQVQLLKEFDGILEMAIGHGALQRLAIESVDRQHDTLEPVPDIGHIRQPLHVHWYVSQ